MNVLIFLLSVVDLFDGVLKAIMSVSILSFFMTALLFFGVISFFVWLVNWGRKNK
jgi:hypothetical protein